VLQARVTTWDTENLVVTAGFIGHSKHPDRTTFDNDPGKCWLLNENKGVKGIAV
jgi:hypothetical protein